MKHRETELPSEIRLFLLNRVDSVVHLECLLLLRQEAERLWDTVAVAKRLYISADEASSALAALHRRGLLYQDDRGFRYQPESGTLRGLTDMLAALYPKFLFPITHLLHSKQDPTTRHPANSDPDEETD